jgi:hypothetical protein
MTISSPSMRARVSKVGQGGAGVRLRHRDRDDHVAGHHLRHHAPAQSLAAEALDDAHRARTGLEHRKGGRGGDFREFLQHDQRIEVARSGAAELAIRIEAEKTEFGVALQPRARHRLAALLEPRRELRQFLASEAARCLLQHALGFGQGKVHDRNATYRTRCRATDKTQDVNGRKFISCLQIVGACLTSVPAKT